MCTAKLENIVGKESTTSCGKRGPKQGIKSRIAVFAIATYIALNPAGCLYQQHQQDKVATGSYVKPRSCIEKSINRPHYLPMPYLNYYGIRYGVYLAAKIR